MRYHKIFLKLKKSSKSGDFTLRAHAIWEKPRFKHSSNHLWLVAVVVDKCEAGLDLTSISVVWMGWSVQQ